MSVSLDTNVLAQQLQAASLKDGSKGSSEDNTSGVIAAEDKHRIFIGNLGFETTEDELKNQFGDAGEIVSVSLPTRRNYRAKSSRPSGIAFIGYANEEQAEKAVELFNGKSFGDREINVAIARPLPPKTKPVKTEQSEEAENKSTPATDGTPSTAGKKKSRKSKSKQVNGTSTSTGLTQAEDASADTTAATERPAPPKRERGPPSDGTPSSTTLFVAGLDRKVTDSELKEMFSEYNPTNAQVAFRPLQRYLAKKLAEKGQQRLSRGFGFVTFADQEAQLKAMNAMNGHKSGEKELAVKVAIDAPEKDKSQKVLQPPAVESDTA